MRAGRSKTIRQSNLDETHGIGAARRGALSNHFGSLRGAKMAELADGGSTRRKSRDSPLSACRFSSWYAVGECLTNDANLGLANPPMA
jgi:hypothetical protein